MEQTSFKFDVVKICQQFKVSSCHSSPVLYPVFHKPLDSHAIVEGTVDSHFPLCVQCWNFQLKHKNL